MGKQQNIEISPIRAYYNDSDKQNSDWDQVLPISVFDAIYETSDPGSNNLTQLKTAIDARLESLNLNKQNKLPSNGNGNIVIYTGEEGVLGSIPKINTIDINTATASTNKIVTEKAIADLYEDVILPQIGNVDLSEVTGRITSLESQVSQVNTDLAGVNANIDGVNTDLSEVTGRITSLESQVSQLNTDLSEVTDRITSLESQVSQLNTDVETLLENQIPTGGIIGDVLVVTPAGSQWKSLETLMDEINNKYNYEETPVAIIDFKNENIINLYAGEYTINDDIYNVDETGELPIDSSWFGNTLNIIKKASSEDKVDSKSQIISIPGKSVKPIISSAPNSGSITGVDNTMEYRIIDGTWLPVVDSAIVGLTAGTYEVRVKYVPDVSFSGEIETIIVTESLGWELTYDYPGANTVITSANGRLTLSDWTGYNGEVLNENILYDESLVSMDDIKVRLFAKFITDEDFIEVLFDNFGMGTGESNKIQRWGYAGVGDGYIQLYGSNSTGVDIQLRLVKEA